MAKVVIRAVEASPAATTIPNIAGGGETRAVFEQDDDPIHVYFNRLDSGAALAIGPKPMHSVVYVWHGAARVGERLLGSGSSMIVESGATLTIFGAQAAELIIFAASRPSKAAESGKHVHLLPRDAVPRMGNPGAVQGGMHADASLPTCSVWLHENSFPAMLDTQYDPEKGIHSHSEDEVIFVTSGQMRLGKKLFGSGTAIAIAAHSMYGFTPGPEGLSFINFRPTRPSEIHFASGDVIDEVAYWQNGTGSPHYTTLQA